MHMRTLLSLLAAFVTVNGAWAQYHGSAQSGQPGAASPVPAPWGQGFSANPATGECPVGGPCGSASAPDGVAGRFWVGAEYLLWWMRGDRLPPLVTASPPGTPLNQAGVLGAPGTVVLFGGERTNAGLRLGGRITAGAWLDCGQHVGVEASVFLLESKDAGLDLGSSGDPILGRPFTDALSNQPSAERVAFPGDLSGRVSVTNTSTGLLGAGALLRGNLCCGCGYRLDVLAGYRHLRLTDRLVVREGLTSVNPASPAFIPVGTRFQLVDSFAAENEFHGFDVGLAGETLWGRLALRVLAKLAWGVNEQTVDIGGSTTVTTPGLPPVTNPGGLLALSSSSGQFRRRDYPVIPELGVKVSYQLAPRWRVSAGYTVLFWSDVARAGDQIDTTVNPNLLPPVAAPVSGPNRPLSCSAGATCWFRGSTWARSSAINKPSAVSQAGLASFG